MSRAPESIRGTGHTARGFFQRFGRCRCGGYSAPGPGKPDHRVHCRPAAFNGVVGYKASFGAVSRDGAHPLSGSLDHIGFFTRSVADAAAAFALFIAKTPEVVRSEASWQQYFQAKSAPKLAVMRTGVWQRASAEQQSNFEEQLVALRNVGAARGLRPAGKYRPDPPIRQ